MCGLMNGPNVFMFSLGSFQYKRGSFFELDAKGERVKDSEEIRCFSSWSQIVMFFYCAFSLALGVVFFHCAISLDLGVVFFYCAI